MGAMHGEMNMGEKVLDTNRLWSAGLAEAMSEAKSTGKYLLVAAGSEPARSWKLGVALAFLDDGVISLSGKFHCVVVTEKDEKPAGRPVVMVYTPDGRLIVSAAADTVDELIPAIRAMMEHVIAVEKRHEACMKCMTRTRSTMRPMSIGRFFGALAHAILS